MQRMYTPMASSAWLIDQKQKNPMAFQISAGARNPHRKKNPSKWNSEKVYPSPVYLHFKNSLSPSAKPQGSNISKMRGGWSWFIFPLCSGQSCKICLVCVCARALQARFQEPYIFTIFRNNSIQFLTIIYLLQSDPRTIYKAKFLFLLTGIQADEAVSAKWPSIWNQHFTGKYRRSDSYL